LLLTRFYAELTFSLDRTDGLEHRSGLMTCGRAS
jgi:hypothetical protein